MNIKKEIVKKATIQNKPDTTAGVRINKEEKIEIQNKAKSLGLNFTQLLLGCWRYLKEKL